MDPATCIADYITTGSTAEKLTLGGNLRAWYYRKGFHPLLSHVKAEVEKRGKRWTETRKANAVALGAV